MEDLKGTYINGFNGELIKITDIDDALHQAKSAVSFHERKVKTYKEDSEVLIYPEAQKEWIHNLLELEKLKMKLDSIVVEKVEEIEDTFYSDLVTKVRKMYPNSSGRLGFIRNGDTSPLYGVDCNYLFMSDNSRIKLKILKIGESIKNSSGTLITRVF